MSERVREFAALYPYICPRDMALDLPFVLRRKLTCTKGNEVMVLISTATMYS